MAKKTERENGIEQKEGERKTTPKFRYSSISVVNIMMVAWLIQMKPPSPWLIVVAIATIAELVYRNLPSNQPK